MPQHTRGCVILVAPHRGQKIRIAPNPNLKSLNPAKQYVPRMKSACSGHSSRQNSRPHRVSVISGPVWKRCKKEYYVFEWYFGAFHFPKHPPLPGNSNLQERVSSKTRRTCSHTKTCKKVPGSQSLIGFQSRSSLHLGKPISEGLGTVKECFSLSHASSEMRSQTMSGDRRQLRHQEALDFQTSPCNRFLPKVPKSWSCLHMRKSYNPDCRDSPQGSLIPANPI